MDFVGIDRVVYGVTDMEKARQFFADWGLKRVRSGRTATVFETVNKSEVVLRPADAPDLPPPIEPGSTVREVIWGIKKKKRLAELAESLAKAGPVREDKDGTIHTTDPMGLGIGFRISRRLPLTALATPLNAPGRVDRMDKRSTIYERATPQAIGHIVFTAPDIAAMERFYTKRVGFWVSDRYDGRGVFMRCSKVGSHHNFFLIKSPDGTAHINHVAFMVRDIHEVFGGGLNITRRGWQTEVGPGRHPVSSAYFWYVKTPAGGACEYFADEDVISPKWKIRKLANVPENFAEWALADGIVRTSADIKEARAS
jgi:catechol 2,3-dioxygenase-like lactoylglutathione lyase family enzyme